jgi:hypothetical protein
MGLESKWGIARIMHAREFRRAATHALRFVKVSPSYAILHNVPYSYYHHTLQSKTDNPQSPFWKGDGDEPYVADGSNLYQIHLGVSDPTTDPTLASVAGIARHLYRCYLSCRDAFPTLKKRDEWTEIVWCEASIRTGLYPGPYVKHEWVSPVPL